MRKVYIYKRFDKNDTIVVMLNNNLQMYNIPEEYKKYEILFSGDGNSEIIRPFGCRILRKE